MTSYRCPSWVTLVERQLWSGAATEEKHFSEHVVAKP
eukprot:CAMPEP_0198371278 /NCGR_PEP_ID=MMETSP1450-20131203/157147_1 /TAXON_ID=753684 ORGANISM="Madagascaria erythrocladiodes, Strain CCMP3234" /NCGR_SAMPLE_ID=MMETSP1450 /ASSEMBLY_ACC=CAM_ASM_001115 /LENGTH=36 /DNA_ID= /DNA_START= /DNA_END= /DNA_ORIENTATION=